MRVLGISWLKITEPGRGGVERFNEYLRRAMKETGHHFQHVAWSDYPNAAQGERIPNPDKALLLGAWAETQFKFDIAVSDGYWGAGIQQHPVAAVVHGTWAQFHANMSSSSPNANPEVRAQNAAFCMMNAHPIAVSPASGRELRRHHKREPYAVINNAVDLEEFTPLKEGRLDCPPIVLHAATNDKKGAQIMPAISRALGPAFQVLPLGAQAGEEARAFQRGDIFLQPSKHEGNAYALLEAMATGLPIVTSSVGLFEDIADGKVGRVLDRNATVNQWAAAVRDVWGDGVSPYRAYARRARDAARLLADFETWKVAWADTLGRILTNR